MEENDRYCNTDFERIFHPKRIAIVGVSTAGVGFGSGIFMSLQSMGYEGEVFLVNPKGGTLNGVPLYNSVEEIPGDIDFAIITVAARAVPAALEACRKKGAAGAEILSAGFKELGTVEGIALEKEVARIAARGIRVVGPNCFGIYCPKSGLTFLPGPDLSRESGPVAFSSQSGGMAVDFAYTGKSIGLKFSKIVSFGNGVDLREVELLRYFGDDPQTRVINMYIEGVEDGERFFSVLTEVAAKKPVIIYKGGLSDAGSRAVRSHTASMGGSREIWRSIIRQAGAVQVTSMSEMVQASLAFSMLPGRAYRNITVLGGGGALGVAAADMAETYGIRIPLFDPELVSQVEALLPRPGSSGRNPVDVANPYVPPKVLKEVLLTAACDRRIDLQILFSLFYHYKNMAKITGLPLTELMPFLELSHALRQVVEKTGKPVIVILPNPKKSLDHLDVIEALAKARGAFLEQGIPVFDDLEEAIRALGHVNTCYGGNSDE
jgi:acyl-CoA synthetase (NDP forming)